MVHVAMGEVQWFMLQWFVECWCGELMCHNVVRNTVDSAMVCEIVDTAICHTMDTAVVCHTVDSFLWIAHVCIIADSGLVYTKMNNVIFSSL